MTIRDDDFSPPTANPSDDTSFFVRQHYLDFLNREPDAPGFQFWLAKLNSFGGDFVRAEMVRAFISSAEYRARFGPS